jgi:ATP-binding cassette subfamily C protein CydCD
MHRRLIRLTASSRVALAIGIACGTAAGLCSLAQAYLLSATVDGVFLGGQNLGQVWPWLRLLLGVIIARGLLLCLQEIAAAEVAVRLKQQLRYRLVGHLLRLGPSFARGERSGELASTAVDGIEALDAYFSQFLPQIAVSLLVPVTILIVVFPLDPLSGVILLVTAPLIPFFMYMIGRTAETATKRQYESLGRLSSHLLDSVQGLTTLKLFGQATAQVRNIGRVADQFRLVTMRVLQVSFLSAFALELLATLSTAIIAVEVGLRLLYGHLVFREALFLLILAPEFYFPLRLLGTRFHAGISGTAAGRRIFEILDTPAPDASPLQSAAPAHDNEYLFEELGGGEAGVPAIELRDVSYTYPGRKEPALERIDLTITGGEHIAVVGASGAGKTTLVSLLLDFITPTRGEVLLSGRPPIRAFPTAGPLRLAWVPQHPHLFHDSIAANIRLGKPDASEAEVIRAARLAHLDEFVQSLPDGYETIIGEAGARLSSGERQRLALARALLVEAPIIVLDEPSSSLDPENEALLEESLRSLSKGRTVLTIAHRLNTVERADSIIVLDRGRIVEQGAHSGLLAQGGHYARLLESGAGGLGTFSSRMADPSEQPHPAGIPFRANSVGPARSESLSLRYERASRRDSVFSKLREFLRGSWGWIALSVLLGTLTIGSSVALMGTSAWLISAAALHPSVAALGLAIVGVRFFGISRAVFRYLERLVSHGVTFRVLRNIRVWVYSRLEPLAPARLMDFRLGDVVARLMADVDALENLFVRVLAPPLTALCVLAGACAFLMLSGEPRLALMLIGMFSLAGAVIPFSARHFARLAGSRMVALRASLQAQLVDAIHGMGDILAFGRLTERQALVRDTGAAYAVAQRATARVGALHSGFSSVAINAALWLTLILVIPLVSQGSAHGIMLASLALVVLTSFEAVVNLPLAGQLWPAMQAATSRILDIVNVVPAVPSTVYPATSRFASSVALPGQVGGPPSLEFARVTLTYPGRSRPALRELSFGVGPGSSAAIVGPSGSGKSTIGHLLLRFWEFDSGEIRFGGQSLRTLLAENVRAQISFASQHPYFFDTSVFENLRLARRGVSRSEVEEAAHRARIHEFICSLPQGYDTQIGEHGARLSAGERQRLGLARLIIKDSPFLLLDEPTANLDASTEAQILSMLLDLMRGRTSLWITHRLLGMEQLDQIIVMDHGANAEQGTHAGLLASGGLYARLWGFQNRQSGGNHAPLADPD